MPAREFPQREGVNAPRQETSIPVWPRGPGYFATRESTELWASRPTTRAPELPPGPSSDENMEAAKRALALVALLALCTLLVLWAYHKGLFTDDDHSTPDEFWNETTSVVTE